VAHLLAAAAPLTADALRTLCAVRNATLTDALTALVAAGRIRKDPTGYVITLIPVSHSRHLGVRGNGNGKPQRA